MQRREGQRGSASQRESEVRGGGQTGGVCVIARGFGKGVRASVGQTLRIPGDQSCLILSRLAFFVGRFVHKGAFAHPVSRALVFK